MTRSEYCLKWAAEGQDKCPVMPNTLQGMNATLKFMEKHVEISTLSPGAIKPLMRERDEDVQAIAITKIVAGLEENTKITATIVKEIIENVRVELGKATRNIRTPEQILKEGKQKLQKAFEVAIKAALKNGLSVDVLRNEADGVLENALYEVLIPEHFAPVKSHHLAALRMGGHAGGLQGDIR